MDYYGLPPEAVTSLQKLVQHSQWPAFKQYAESQGVIFEGRETSGWVDVCARLRSYCMALGTTLLLPNSEFNMIFIAAFHVFEDVRTGANSYQKHLSQVPDEIEVNTQLYMKDGRVVGNAIITSVKGDDVKYRTDYGYTVASTKQQVRAQFWLDTEVYPPAQVQLLRKLKHKHAV